MHQHGVVGMVMRVVGVVGQVCMEMWSASELGKVRGHLMRVGVSWCGHAHAHWTALRYVLPWHAWQTCEGDRK